MSTVYQYDKDGFYIGTADDFGGPMPHSCFPFAPPETLPDGSALPEYCRFRLTGDSFELTEGHRGRTGYKTEVALADMTFGAAGVISPARLINANRGSMIALLPGTLKFLGGSVSAFNIFNGAQVVAHFRAGDVPTIFDVDGYSISRLALLFTGLAGPDFIPGSIPGFANAASGGFYW